MVFIRARALGHLDGPATAALAENIWRKVSEMVPRLGRRSGELQFDCDWSDATRDRFFALLTAVGERARPAGITLSATIRLHQVKYRERTGVPPVERGMLMFYNMGRVDAAPGTNAIFDPAAAERVSRPRRRLPAAARRGAADLVVGDSRPRRRGRGAAPGHRSGRARRQGLARAAGRRPVRGHRVRVPERGAVAEGGLPRRRGDDRGDHAGGRAR